MLLLPTTSPCSGFTFPGIPNGENVVAPNPPLPDPDPNPAPTGDVGLVSKLVEMLLKCAADEAGVVTFPVPSEYDAPLALLEDGGETRRGGFPTTAASGM